MDRPRRNAGSHAEEALGDQFNRMAAHLRDSYATLERKVIEPTSELERAPRKTSPRSRSPR